MVRLSALGIVVLLLVSGVGGVAFGAAGAAGPAAGDASDRAPTADPSANQSDDPQFDFDLVNATECGINCREVTVRATNIGNDSVSNVTVSSRLESGERVVWRGTDSVDRLEPGESAVVTKQVRVGFFDAVAIQQNGGWVAANTTVSWDDRSETFVERRKVT